MSQTHFQQTPLSPACVKNFQQTPPLIWLEPLLYSLSTVKDHPPPELNLVRNLSPSTIVSPSTSTMQSPLHLPAAAPYTVPSLPL
ncbi:hypothetical protein TorRG33x02_219590, partial [Trema orientale]